MPKITGIPGGLIIGRRLGEKISIEGDLIEIQVVKITGTSVRLRFVAPREVDICRTESKPNRKPLPEKPDEP